MTLIVAQVGEVERWEPSEEDDEKFAIPEEGEIKVVKPLHIENLVYYKSEKMYEIMLSR